MCCDTTLLTNLTPPLSHGYDPDSSYVMTHSGSDHSSGMHPNPTIAYKFPAYRMDGSAPKGPPAYFRRWGCGKVGGGDRREREREGGRGRTTYGRG